MKSISKLLLFYLLSFQLNAQGIDQDITLIYMRGNVLFESGRYDEAVRTYNRVLSENDQHTMALFMRARCKYELGAYKGVKMDILKYIEIAGVNKDLIKLMAKTELKLNNLLAAEAYLNTAIELDPYDADLYFEKGLILKAMDHKADACESFARASQLGHDQARSRLLEDCDAIVLPPKIVNSENETHNGEINEDRNTEMPDSIRVLGKLEENPVIPAPPLAIEDLSTENKIEIDEELSLVITSGLGNRKVEFIPEILMLTERKGAVIIRICVGTDGKVTEAEYDRENSEIMSSAMISLALRKTKEILFLPSLRSSQCGVIKFIFN